MLEIKNLTIYLKKDLREVISDFSFVLNSSSKVALIGQEGNGKSTLLKAIYDASLIEDYADISGEILVKNEVIVYLKQESEMSNLEETTYDILHHEVSCELFDYNLYYRLLSDLSLSEDIISEERYYKDLSGGEKVKFRLLVCMMKEPTILLLDEPSNDLDISSLNLLRRFINNLKISVIFISHDEYILEHCADSVIHIEQGYSNKKAVYTVSKLNYREYVLDREKRIERQKHISKKEHDDFQDKMNRFNRVKGKVENQLRNTKDSTTGKNLKDKMRAVKSMEKRYEKEKKNLTQKPDVEKDINIKFSDDLGLHRKKDIVNLKIDELTVGKNVLSKNIILQIKAEDKICIVGDNGVGKSTLVKRVLEELKDNNIKYFYMPQNYEDDLESSMTAVDFLRIDYTKDEETRIRTYLGSLDFTAEEMLRPIDTLSGGQKCKLFFAKMVLENYDFLVLDEATRNLSPISSYKTRESLRAYRGAILAVSHDIAFIESVFDIVYYMSANGLEKMTSVDFKEKYLKR